MKMGGCGEGLDWIDLCPSFPKSVHLSDCPSEIVKVFLLSRAQCDLRVRQLPR